MKIVSSGRVLNSSEFYEKKRRKRRFQLILFIFVCLSGLSFFVWLSRRETFLIAEVVIPAENIVGKEEVVHAARRALAGYYLWLVPRANAFIYQRRALEQNLVDAFPRIKSVTLTLDGFRRLVIMVEERTPFALYCANGLDLLNISECYFLDENGLIFASTASFSRGVYFIYTTPELLVDPLGKRFIKTDEFQSLSIFVKTLTALNIHPFALEVVEDEYRLLLSNGGKIIWRRDADLALIRSNLEAFLSHDSIRNQDSFLDRISLLDLRTESKIFYRFGD